MLEPSGFRINFITDIRPCPKERCYFYIKIYKDLPLRNGSFCNATVKNKLRYKVECWFQQFRLKLSNTEQDINHEISH